MAAGDDDGNSAVTHSLYITTYLWLSRSYELQQHYRDTQAAYATIQIKT